MLADAILIGGVAWAILMVAILLSRGEFGVRFFAVVGLAFGILSCLLLPSNTRPKVALAGVSLALSLLILESVFVLNLIPKAESSPHAEEAHRLGLEYDLRDTYEVIVDLRESGRKAYPRVLPYKFLHTQAPDYFESRGQPLLPLGNPSSSWIVTCNEGGTYPVFLSDEYGFNNPQGTHRVNDVDLAIVGDSFAAGECVSYDHSTMGWLSSSFDKVLCVSAGGNGPLFDLALFREYIEHLQPEIVLWFHYEGNDIRNLRNEMNDAILRRYLDPTFSQGLRDVQPEVDRVLTRWIEAEIDVNRNRLEVEQQATTAKSRVLDLVLLRDLRGRLWTILRKFRFEMSRDTEENALKLFADIQRLVSRKTAEWGGRYYVVYLPAWCRFSEHTCARLARNQVLSILEELRIPVVDTTEDFEAHGDPLSLFPFRSHGHYNEDGYRLVADSISRRLSEEKNLP